MYYHSRRSLACSERLDTERVHRDKSKCAFKLQPYVTCGLHDHLGGEIGYIIELQLKKLWSDHDSDPHHNAGCVDPITYNPFLSRYNNM